jgi:hypothetical protein
MEILNVSEGTESFDREFWAAQSGEARLMAGWELAKLAHFTKGGTEDELRLRRTPIVVQTIQR